MIIQRIIFPTYCFTTAIATMIKQLKHIGFFYLKQYIIMWFNMCTFIIVVGFLHNYEFDIILLFVIFNFVFMWIYITLMKLFYISVVILLRTCNEKYESYIYIYVYIYPCNHALRDKRLRGGRQGTQTKNNAHESRNTIRKENP